MCKSVKSYLSRLRSRTQDIASSVHVLRLPNPPSKRCNDLNLAAAADADADSVRPHRCSRYLHLSCPVTSRFNAAQNFLGGLKSGRQISCLFKMFFHVFYRFPFSKCFQAHQFSFSYQETTHQTLALPLIWGSCNYWWVLVQNLTNIFSTISYSKLPTYYEKSYALITTLPVLRMLKGPYICNLYLYTL